MRYFYTDSLQAAWMESRFGVKFENAELSIIGNSMAYYFVNPRDGSRFKGRFYIHPDSLKLLEPQEGDIGIEMVKSARGEETLECGIFQLNEHYNESSRWLTFQKPNEHDHNDTLSGKEKVIFRNGKPFFWPEIEI